MFKYAWNVRVQKVANLAWKRHRLCSVPSRLECRARLQSLCCTAPGSVWAEGEESLVCEMSGESELCDDSGWGDVFKNVS